MYVVLIGLVIVVFASLLPKTAKGAKEASPDLMKDMEETMEGFLAELEEDNQKLIGTVASMKQEHEASIKRLSDKLDLMEKELHEVRQEMLRSEREKAQRLEAESLELAKAIQSVPNWGLPLHGGIPYGPPGKVSAPSAPEAAPTPPPVEEPDHSSIRARYPELLQLHEDGKSVEYIAKKLGMNKGEVSLILQLAVQEGRIGAEK